MHFKELKAWQHAVELSIAVYDVTDRFPDTERFSLTRQIQRCAVSVASNIAEGRGRGTIGEFIQFLGIARGSLFELETQLYIAARRGYLTRDHERALMDRIEETSRTLSGLRSSLKARS